MLTSLILAATVANASAPLDLREAAALAATGAPAVERAQAQTEVARARFSLARAPLGPALFADVGFLSSDNPVTVFSLALEQERFSAEKFFLSDPNHPAYTKDWSGAISLAWSVDPFGATRAGARAAGEAARAADLRSSRVRDAAAFQAIAAFAEARRAEDALALLREREADAEQDVSIAQALADEGVTTAADPARARAALAELRAEIAGEQAAASNARASLAALIGPAAERPLAPLPEPPASTGDAASERADVAAAKAAAAAAQESGRAAAAARWPSLLVTGRYEVHAPTPGGRYGDSGTVFAGFRVPLFASGAVDARIAEAHAEARAAAAAAVEAGRAAEAEVLRARADTAAARARRAAFAEAERAARAAREIQQERYAEGAARLGDLLEARAVELHARRGASSASAEAVVAEANLRLALGLPPEGEKP